MSKYPIGIECYNSARKNTALKASGSEPPHTERASLPMNPSRASLPTQDEINAGPHAGLGTIPSDYSRIRSPPMDPISVLTHALHKLSRAEIVQEIRELQAQQLENSEQADLVYSRINELLEMLDNEP